MAHAGGFQHFLIFFFYSFTTAALWRTLYHTFNSLRHRGNPLNDDKDEIPSLVPMTPFCCREASPQPGNQTWLPAGGQCWRSQAEKQGGHRELGKLSRLWNLFHLPGTGFMAAFKTRKSFSTDVPHWEYLGLRDWPRLLNLFLSITCKFQGGGKERTLLFWLMPKIKD